MTDDIYIKDCGSYYTVINLNGTYENHAHIDHKKAAELLKKQIERKIVPKGKYFRSCALRITVDERYKEKILTKAAKDRNKQSFFNVNKGVVKK